MQTLFLSVVYLLNLVEIYKTIPEIITFHLNTVYSRLKIVYKFRQLKLWAKTSTFATFIPL